MNQAILLATLSALLTQQIVAKPSFASLPEADQSIIQAKLAKWKTLYGRAAVKHGYTPSQEALSVDTHTDDELERFHSTILDVQEASKQNPQATFSEFNQFALMTMDEFRERLKASFGSHNATEMAEVDEAKPFESLESEVDWSKTKCIGPVLNQGSCASCWAFSSVGTAQAAHCIATGELLDLSEQQLVSCETTSHGCGGGYPPIAMNWMQEGVCLESDWPYTSGTSKITGKCTTTCEKKKLSMGKLVRVKGESALLSALNSQPVTVLVEAGNLVWKNYKGGVVTQCPGFGSDHAVIAVGYGTSTDDYIKIKNSWGPEWGDNGYISLKRGVDGLGMCNVVESISFPKVLDSSPLPSNAPKPSTSAPSTKQPTPSIVPATTFTPRTTTAAPATTAAPTASPTTSKPKRTHKPRTPKTSSPTTSAPPQSTNPPQTTNSPAPTQQTNCGRCRGCYFAEVKWCVKADFAKKECENTDGAIWCGK